MNVDFTPTHMKTLAKLQEMAKKHNGFLIFGFESTASRDVDYDMVNEDDGKKFVDFLGDCSLEQTSSESSGIWFELHVDGKRAIFFSYIEKSTYFELYSYDVTELDNSDIEAEKDLSGRIGDSDGRAFYYHHSPTTIRIKGTDKPITDYRVYRPGMALSYFSDVMCDYLKEPEIVETY